MRGLASISLVLFAGALALSPLAGALARSRPASDAELRRYWREIVTNCGFPASVTLRRTGRDRYRLSLPARLYAHRAGPRTHGRIMCVDHWALEQGADLDVRRINR
jgi:hypothetical protein